MCVCVCARVCVCMCVRGRGVLLSVERKVCFCELLLQDVVATLSSHEPCGVDQAMAVVTH